jgi:6-phosphogluconolactonase (cycloisomerase 2 family)
MTKKTGSMAMLVCLLASAMIAATMLNRNTASAQTRGTGAVYVMTNQVNNAVAVFNRAADGSLAPAGMFSTGGMGNPVAQPGDPPTDPLASQGSLILSNGFLFAVNAGSNEISVFVAGGTELTLVDKVASGGSRPISLTIHGNLLYALNEGGTPNITGFTVSGTGRLSPLAGSTRPLSGGSAADPAQVGFSSDGGLLVVTEKKTNTIDTYTIGADGLASGPMANPSNGLTPFGFQFNSLGNLIVAEAAGGAPGQASASSYAASAGGLLSVVTGSAPNSQTASCWVAIPGNGQFAYISNTGSGTISSYRVGLNGALTLLNPVAANTGPSSAPIDMASTGGGRYLYALGGGSRMVHAFRVELDGSLTPIGGAGGLPPGIQGIAAR